MKLARCYAVPIVLMVEALVFASGVVVNTLTVVISMIALTIAWLMYLQELKISLAKLGKKSRSVSGLERQTGQERRVAERREAG